MKKHVPILVLSAAALLAAGCFPEEYIWWSNDGQTAAIRAPDGLRLADTNGQLSAVILAGEIQAAAWLPGGLLQVSRSYSLTNWAAVEKVIPPEETAETVQMAQGIPDLLKAGLKASGGSWPELEEKLLKRLGAIPNPRLESAWLCALDLHRKEILQIAATALEAPKLENEILSQTNGIPVFEISTIAVTNGRPAGQAQALVRSLYPALDPIRSPRYSILAFRTGDAQLKAVALDGKRMLTVADEKVVSAAWSAEGGTLIYVTKAESDLVGEIRLQRVVNSSGELLEEAAKAETIALATFASGTAPKLRVLPDGRVLFASVPIQLPARSASLQPQARFYLLDLAQPGAGLTAVEITEGSLPDDLNAFAVSPDGRMVAVVEAGTDAVAVLDLKTGKVSIISPPHESWKSRMIPSWRNARELTFGALPSTNAARAELILWQADASRRILSQSWPDHILEPWLEK